MALTPTRSNPAYLALVVIGALLTLAGIVVALVGGNNERVAAIAASLVGVPHEPNPWPVVIGIVIAVFGAALLAAALIIRAAKPAASLAGPSEVREPIKVAKAAPLSSRNKRALKIGAIVGAAAVGVLATVLIVQGVQRAQQVAAWHELTEHQFDSTMDDGDVVEFGAAACEEMQSHPEGVDAAYDAWVQRNGYSKSEDAFNAFDASIKIFCP